MKIDGAKLLVTGGCGFIGSATIDLLLNEHSPECIVIFDDLSRGSLDNVEKALADSRVSFIQADIRDADAICRAAEGMDAIFHMAALRVPACAADPRRALEVMCDGSFNVLEAARDQGVRKVIAASSASVYGLAEVFPTPENHHPYNDRTWYGAAKVMLEGLLRSFNEMYGLDYVALRYFNVYGPRMDVHGKYTEVLVRWIERIASGEPPLISGDGQATMDFVYVDDVARANVLALSSNVSGDVFNIARGEEVSLNELASALLRVMGSSLQPEFRSRRSINAVSRRLADVSRANQALGFRAEVSLEEGLSRLADWWITRRRAA